MLWLTGAVMLRVVDRASSRLMPVAAVVALVLAAALGVWQVGQTRGRWAAQPAMTVSVVQPSVLIGLTPEALVQGPSEGEVAEREQVLADLTRRAANAPSVPGAPHIIVWPESALERGSPEYRPDITRVASTPKTFLVAGGRHYVHSPASEGGFQARNGAFLFGPDGRQRDVYDKMHLVPFGEYVPLRPLVQRFFTVRSRDVVPGPTRRTLEADGRRLGVAICFESTFPAIARAYARSGAEVLVVMTNDAWFQRTSAVPQHFNHSRFRAIETGLPVARAASSGISGVIAPNGQVLAEIPVYQRGVRTLDLREGVPGTLNTAGGWLFGPGCLLAAVVLMVWGWRRREASTVATHPQAE
jgi:apolipoprotein N-acyltransferase